MESGVEPKFLFLESGVEPQFLFLRGKETIPEFKKLRFDPTFQKLRFDPTFLVGQAHGLGDLLHSHRRHFTDSRHTIIAVGDAVGI